MLEAAAAEHVQRVRAFNRAYTREIGLLHEGLLDSSFSLTEVRVLYELAQRKQPAARELCQALEIDPGYMSRILRSFQKQQLLARSASNEDGRRALLELTPKGREVFATLDARSARQIASMLGNIPTAGQKQLVQAMQSIQDVLGKNHAPQKAPYLLRPHQPGDMGWVVHRHGVLYAREYGYDECFEALVAEIVAEFIRNFDSGRERCWMAEKDGEIAGSVFLVKHTKMVAKLRLLLVEPNARGLGIGRRLVDECVRFARQADYKKIVLWTQSELTGARHIYKSAGFRVAGRKSHRDWGRKLVAETWELKL